MKFRLTQSQTIALAGPAILLLVFSLFPTRDAPHFRYTGSDPDREVWNLGLPVATCIIDPQTRPYFFVGPFAMPYAIGAAVFFSNAYALLLLWNNAFLRDTRSPAHRLRNRLVDDLRHRSP